MERSAPAEPSKQKFRPSLAGSDADGRCGGRPDGTPFPPLPPRGTFFLGSAAGEPRKKIPRRFRAAVDLAYLRFADFFFEREADFLVLLFFLVGIFVFYLLGLRRRSEASAVQIRGRENLIWEEVFRLVPMLVGLAK